MSERNIIDVQFAVFIITRHRSEILKDTILRFRLQSLQPSAILVVDNSDDTSTEYILKELNDSSIQYHRVGFNAGPAGAAKIAMELLFSQGYERVVWGDDDDPPFFSDALYNLIQLSLTLEKKKKIGMVGASGSLFSAKKGKMIRLPDNVLKDNIEVDSIAGCMFPVIHKNVFEQGIRPDPKLFFGFEELDFCLSIRRAGFHIVVSGEEMYRYRNYAGRLNLKTKSYNVKRSHQLWREYYSTRNMLYILFCKEKNLRGSFVFLIKSMAKCLWGYQFGLRYGTSNFLYVSKGIIDCISGRMGQRITPVKKY